MLNSAEHEISTAHKFLALSLSDVVSIMLINVKMPTGHENINFFKLNSTDYEIPIAHKR